MPPGYSSSRISNWEQGTRSPGPEEAEDLARAFGGDISASFILCIDEISHPKNKLKEIPVVGTTQGGPDHHWEELGYPPGWGDEYAVLESDDPHAYLLRVEGDSMSPRINEGEYVLVTPSIQAQPGDIIVARLISGEVMLKNFKADYGDEIALESHNHGYALRTLRRMEIVFMHLVSGVLFRRVIRKR